MADQPLRASVRRMVEFSLRGGDILPVRPTAMIEGGRAHRARQQAAAAIAERPVRWQGGCDGISCEIQGRIDLLWEGHTPPCVDELKLISEAAPLPAAAVPVHRMQAVCYGFMLCAELVLPAVCVRVSYVTEQGVVRAFFEETLTAEEAEGAFFSMLRPLAAWHQTQTAYQARRDAALAALRFPYDQYRPGQREMAVQVYTAIDRRKRLFATLPTGTGKSAATLFPALKALGEGKTRQIFCLTARGTSRLSAQDVLRRLGLPALRSLVITAKEKCCPVAPMRCHPDFCPRARGYYDRELPALMKLCRLDRWTEEDVAALCEREQLCPFEFSLALAEISDVVICDYNYVFDPLVSLRRIIGQGLPVTLLIDEAHNLPGRAREMLSATLDGAALAAFRRACGKALGRKSALYAACTALIKPLREQSSSLLPTVEALIGCMAGQRDTGSIEGFSELFRALLQCRMALERQAAAPDDYAALWSGAKEKSLRLLCLNISDHLRECTRRLRGSVCFSATLSPLEEMKALLGGEEEDAAFALPSPFPPDHLLVMARAVNTRYQQRQESAADIARSIAALCAGRAGRYAAYFPSYAYLMLIREQLETLYPGLPLNVQDRGMEEEARLRFLDRMKSAEGTLLSLCVLGGIFSEGIDLPGSQLIGAAVVGVGLPQVNAEQEALRDYYQQSVGDGFGFAYRTPGMQKVLQAAGRVIRGEDDAGVVLLLDDRYREAAYRRLLPPHYNVKTARDEAEIQRMAKDFWQSH